MQDAETQALTLKVGNSEELEPCCCDACYTRRDFNGVCSVPRPRELYSNPRDARLGSQMPIASYPLVAEYPATRTSLHRTPYNLHRPAGYARAFYFAAGPESRSYESLPRMRDMQNETTTHENFLVHSQPLQMQPNLETSNRAPGSSEKPRRMRTVFTPQQLERLERHFTRQQYVGGAQRLYIAKQLGLSETQVKVWFQNRRIRWRKQVLSTTVTSQS